MWQDRGWERLNKLFRVTQFISGPFQCGIQVWLIPKSRVFLSFCLVPAPWPLVVLLLSSVLFSTGFINTSLPFAEWLHLSSSFPPSTSNSSQPLDACLQIHVFQELAGFHVMECCTGDSRTGCRVGPDEQKGLSNLPIFQQSSHMSPVALSDGSQREN